MDTPDDDLEIIEKKRFNVSCCRSYATPRGRCYSCPEEWGEEPEEESEKESEKS